MEMWNVVLDLNRRIANWRNLVTISKAKTRSKGTLRFIEVKGRASGEAVLTVTKNEILYSLNVPDDFILGMVEFKSDGTHQVHYLRRPFQREPDFGVTSVNYNFPELLARAEPPR